jgi:hypothetical protein
VRRPLALLTLLLSLLAMSRPAAAEEPGAVASAREHFLRGVDLYQDGDYEAALADFEQAYELAPHWGLLYNIGRVRAELHAYPAAVEALERYLREGGREVPADRRGEVQREVARLRGLVGRVVLEVERPAVTVVYVDGTEAGSTPMEGPLLVAAGRRTIEIRAEGFMPFRREIAVAGGTEERLRIALTPAATTTGSIFVSSTIPGLTVSLDGEEVGETPLSEPMPASPGRHMIEGVRPGYEAEGRSVEVEAGQLASVELRPRQRTDLPRDLSGRIHLEASERDVEVVVDGQPLQGETVPVGPHVVEVRLGGFHEWSRQVDVAAGETLRVEAELLPTEAFLERYRARARSWQIASWLTVGGGLAILGTFVGLEVWVLGRYSDWRAERDGIDAEYADAMEHGTLDQIAAVVARLDRSDTAFDAIETENGCYIGGIVLGGVAAVGGLILAFVGPRPGRYSRIALAPGPGSFHLAMTW